MNNVSHRGRWMYNPLGQYQPRTWWEKLLRCLDELFQPLLLPEGRRRIDPALPYGHWANGWSRPTLPHTEGGHKPTNEANACAWPKCSQHAALRRGMADTKKMPGKHWHAYRAKGESFGNNSPRSYHRKR